MKFIIKIINWILITERLNATQMFQNMYLHFR